MAAAAVVYMEFATNDYYSDLRSSAVLQMIEYAAKNALQSNMGLTCDPVLGLVLIPCIQRNGVAAMKALDCGLIAMAGLFDDVISLDEAIEILYVTG